MIRSLAVVVLAAVLLTGCRVIDTDSPTTTAPPPAPAPSAPALPLDLPLGEAGSGLDGHP